MIYQASFSCVSAVGPLLALVNPSGNAGAVRVRRVEVVGLPGAEGESQERTVPGLHVEVYSVEAQSTPGDGAPTVYGIGSGGGDPAAVLWCADSAVIIEPDPAYEAVEVIVTTECPDRIVWEGGPVYDGAPDLSAGMPDPPPALLWIGQDVPAGSSFVVESDAAFSVRVSIEWEEA